MRTILPDIQTLSLYRTLGKARLDLEGEQARDVLEQHLFDTPPSSIIAFDLRHLKYLGYSYFKRSIRELLLERNQGKYGDRRLFLVSDQGGDFLDDIGDALGQLKLFMMVSDRPDSLENAYLIGDVPPHIAETFDALRKTAPITTGSLARLLDQSPQNTKNRLDRLHQMGLLTREKRVSPTGGLEWENWIF